MSGPLSSLTGGGGTPIGASILALDAPVNFTQGGAEYLRTGSIKAYDASYAASIAAAPQLRVFGNDAKTYGTATSNIKHQYYFIGSNYFNYAPGSTWNRNTALATLTANTITSSNLTATVKRLAVRGTAHAICPHSAANTAPWFTADGITITAVGGTFTTFPVPTACTYASVLPGWMTLSSLTGTVGELGYIANANPSGTWTVAAGTNIGMTSVSVMASLSGTFVFAAGVSASATSGKLAYCSILGGAWTDITSSSGIPWVASSTIEDLMVTSAGLLLIKVDVNIRTLFQSANGLTWTAINFPIDQSTLNPQSGALNWSGAGASSYELTGELGATVVLNYMATSGGVGRVVMAISQDGGLTWGCASVYTGKVGAVNAFNVRTVSLANGRWIANHAGSVLSMVDIGPSLATPDFIGNQLQLAAGQYVRIK